MPERRVFVYGTLQFPEIAAAVTGRRHTARRARLQDYGRFQVRDAPFPGITPLPGACVDGLVYTGVGAEALTRMAAFEGAMYRREEVIVQPEAGDAVAAQAFVVRPRWRPLLRDRDWDADAFARHWRAACPRRFTGDRATGRSRR